MNLEEKRIVDPCRLHLLVDDAHLGAERNFVKQPLDVFGIEMHTAVTHVASDTVGLVGAVNKVARPAKTKGIGTERIVRPRGNDLRKLGSFLMDRGRWIPSRIGLLGDNAGRTDRR